MSEPKLYRVRIEADVYVVSTSEHDAEQYVLRDHDAMFDAMDNALAVASVATAKGLRRDEGMSLPWVDDDLEGDVDRDRTVRDWAAMNDAAVERALREREFNARQLTLSGT